MGLSLSLLHSAWEEIARHSFFRLGYNINFSPKYGGGAAAAASRVDSFKKTSSETMTNPVGSKTTRSRKNSLNLRNCRPEKVILERNLSLRDLVLDQRNLGTDSLINGKDGLANKPLSATALPDPEIMFSPRPVSELVAAAVKVQKVYKSYRTRRNLADCAVVVEELWWKALDFAALKRSSVSFFNDEKPETAVSKWARARTMAARVGKGLCKDEKAQKLALQHWLEAIDPRHRYGHNLHFYYDVWFESESTQPFFYWLDVGAGKEVNLEKCPRAVLQRQCIKYLGPKERQSYEVIVEDGKLVYRQSGMPVNTVEGSKWIFVLSTTRALYIGQKKKGLFQHSSFLAGGATTAAGRLVAYNGVLKAIWPYSGHYHPTEEHFREFVSFLEENNVDLTNVKRCSIDEEDSFSFKVEEEEKKEETVKGPADSSTMEDENATTDIGDTTKEKTRPAVTKVNQQGEDINSNEANVEAVAEAAAPPPPPPIFDLGGRLSCKWTTGNGPRIGCVREYPTELQSRALEQVKLSPRVPSGQLGSYGPIPSPRPSPNVRVSPRLSYLGHPSPRTAIPAAG